MAVDALGCGAPPGQGDAVSRYDAVFFDFDGVILESSGIKGRAFRALYQEHGSDVAEAAVAHHEAHDGVCRRKKIRHCHSRLLGMTLSKTALDALARRFSGLLEDAVVASDWVPGAEALLERSRRRLALFVVSRTPESELRRIISRRGMAGCFHSVRGAPPEKVPIIRALLHDHDLLPSRTLFIGDQMNDYDAARATGLDFVGRVAPGQLSPFPPGTRVVSDLTQLKL
jgi:phosphoglycolate phosphatase-like HAD superfamily hydrolase